MTEKERFWTFLILSVLLIEQVCVWNPESDYCQSIRPYLCDPEPISTSTSAVFSVPSPSAAPNSGTTTTT